MGLFSSTRQPHTRCALRCTAAGRQREGSGVDGTGVEWRGGEGRGGEGRGGEGRAGGKLHGSNHLVTTIAGRHDWSYHRSLIATTSRTMSYYGSCHRHSPIVRDIATTHRSKHCRSVAPWLNRNQSYGPEIVRSGVTLVLRSAFSCVGHTFVVMPHNRFTLVAYWCYRNFSNLLNTVFII